MLSEKKNVLDVFLAFFLGGILTFFWTFFGRFFDVFLTFFRGRFFDVVSFFAFFRPPKRMSKQRPGRVFLH